MAYDLNDTIVAIGTAPGGAVRGMIRLSGPHAIQCLKQCFRSTERLDLSTVLQPTAISGTATIADGRSLPCELFLWPTEKSYTKQPSAELHTLGSPPLLDQLVRAVCNAGARLAERGEFTLRAFLAGRIDLTQAEAVLGVIDSNHASDFQSSLQQLAGGLSKPLFRLRDSLMGVLAELEAGLDFVDEDIEFISREQVSRLLSAIQSELGKVIEQLSTRELAHELPRVVLSGPPNAGKSSLFNALAKRYAASTPPSALVSEKSGTTRDFVSTILCVNSLDFELVDTAGTDDAIEDATIDGLAQRKTSEQREQATLVVHCVDCAQASNQLFEVACESVIAITKSDLHHPHHSNSATRIPCSSVTGEGVDQLAERIATEITNAAEATDGSLTRTASRCRESLTGAHAAIHNAIQLAENQYGDELIAAEIREALTALGQVVGTVYTDDILDRIFGQFCIGK